MRSSGALALMFVGALGCGFSRNPDTGTDAPNGQGDSGGGGGGGGSDADSGSGSGSGTEPDAAAFDPGTPIAGGGVAGGAGSIQGDLAVYVIDATTAAPLAGAHVVAGALTGTTDAAGLAVFHAAALTGKLAVGATLAGYRAELFVGVDGNRVTLPLAATGAPAPTATLAVTSAALDTPAIMANHTRAMDYVIVSSDETTILPSGSTTQPGCTLLASGSTCTATTAQRPGTFDVFGRAIDTDLHTGSPLDDTSTLLAWHFGQGATNPGAVALTAITSGFVQPSVALGTKPAGLDTGYAFYGVDLGDGQYALLSTSFTFPGQPSSKLPPLSALPAGAGYRALAVAQDDPANPTAASYAIVKGGASATMAVASWLAPTANVQAMPAQLAWTPAAGETYTIARFSTVEVVALDHETAIPLPAGFTLTANDPGSIIALRGAGVDVASFGLVADGAKVDAVSTRRATASN